VSETLTPEEMDIFDLDKLGSVDSLGNAYPHIGCEVLDAEGNSIPERTLLLSKHVLIPHPFMPDQLMSVVVHKRSQDGSAVAYGYGMAALLSHDDASGWCVTGLLDERTHRDLMEAEVA